MRVSVSRFLWGIGGTAALVGLGCQPPQGKAKPQERVVALVPFQGLDAKSIATARKALERTTRAKVVVLNFEQLPKQAYYAPRKRYRAEKLLGHLAQKPYWHVVGLTHRDISTTKGPHFDWGLFGLGSCPGKSCVVSTFRLGRRKDRLEKVVVHEFGHTLGLPHCPTPRCLMNDAKGKAATVDAAREFCRSCRSHIVAEDSGQRRRAG